jgi:hypothetical protein
MAQHGGTDTMHGTEAEKNKTAKRTYHYSSEGTLGGACDVWRRIPTTLRLTG